MKLTLKDKRFLQIILNKIEGGSVHPLGISVVAEIVRRVIALDSRCIPEDVCEIEQRASEFLEYVCSEFGQAGNAEKPSWLTGVEGEEVEEEGGEDHSFFTGDNDEGRIIPFPESSQIDNRDGDEAEVPHLRSLGDGDL